MREDIMPWTLDSALQDDLITVIDRNDQLGSYAIRIGELETVVFIELGRLLTNDAVKFNVSHSIHTPIQAGPYRSGRFIEDDAGYALHRAIDALTSWYRQAVQEGCRPQENWLIKE
jgi:hypothetical protein